jgi:hypothetical protein
VSFSTNSINSNSQALQTLQNRITDNANGLSNKTFSSQHVFPVGNNLSQSNLQTTVNQQQNNDFTRNIADIKIDKNMYTANLKAIKMQDRINGELLDLVG